MLTKCKQTQKSKNKHVLCYCEILIIGYPLVDSRNKIGEKGVVILYTTRVVFTKLDIHTQKFLEA
jgi:hypothetical protein